MRALIRDGLSACVRPEDAPVFAAPEAARELLGWYDLVGTQGRVEVGVEALERAMRLRLEDPDGDLEELARVAVLAAEYEPGARELLARLTASANTDAERQALAVGLVAFRDARGRSAFRVACGTGPFEEQCRWAQERLAAREAPRSLDERVARWDFHVPTFLRAHPSERTALVSALGRCVARLDEPGAERASMSTSCLEWLATLDWKRAKQVPLPPTPADNPNAELEELRMLLKFDDRAHLTRELRKLNLIPPGEETPEFFDDGQRFATPTVRVEQLLAAHQRLLRFDLMADYGQVLDVQLLRELAALSRPALEGAIFEEVAVRGEGDPSGDELVAYLDGARYAIPSRASGEWYDVETVLELLNAVLQDRNADLEYRALKSDDGRAMVVVGPPAALDRAVALGWLELEPEGGLAEANDGP